MPFTLNPRVVAMLKALPEGPEREFLKELMKYEIERHSGERAEKRYKDDLMKLVEKYTIEGSEKA